MSHDLKPLQLHMVVPVRDPRFALGARDLLLHCVDSVEIRQKEPALDAFADNDAVAPDIQFVGRLDRLRLAQDIHTDLEPGQLVLPDRVEPGIPGRRAYRIIDDLLRQAVPHRGDRPDTAPQSPMLVDRDKDTCPARHKFRQNILGDGRLFVLSETLLGDVLESVNAEKPDVLIIDSIQTLSNEELDSPAGSVGQVKDCTMALMQLASDAEDSRNLLMLSQRSNVEFIMNQPEGIIQKLLLGSSPEKINGRMSEIRQSLCAVNMVSFAEAMAYQELGEHEAARKSLTYYAGFIDDTYVSVPGLVDRLDLIDPAPENYWSKTLPDISKKIQALPSAPYPKLLETKRGRRKKR